MPKVLTPAQRKALKARAHALDPVVLIGDSGLTPMVLLEIDRSLAAHELIKIRVSGDREAREGILQRMCAELGAAPVQHIGKILVVFREIPEDSKPKPTRKPRRKPARKLKRSFQNEP